MNEKSKMLPPTYEMSQQAVTTQPGVYQPQMNPAMPNMPMPQMIPGDGPNVAMQGIWMQMPAPIPGCPIGMEYLASVEEILCHQQVDVAEIFSSWECSNRYAIKTKQGQQIYYAFEESDMCMRQCCEKQRSYCLHVVNNINQEVFQIKRPFKCCAENICCCAFLDCCAQESGVYLPDGTPIGGQFFQNNTHSLLVVSSILLGGGKREEFFTLTRDYG